MKNISAPKKILIIIIKDIGDVMLSEPVAAVLRKNYPDAQIDVMSDARCSPVLQNNPDISNVIIYDKKQPVKSIFAVRKTRYDWVIDLLSNPRSAIITALSGAKVRAGNERNFHKIYAYNFKFKYPDTDYIYNPDLKLNFLKQLGVKWPSEHAPLPKYNFTPEQLKKREEIYKTAGINKNDTVIGFFATPVTQTRTWPAQYFRELAPLLHKKYKAKILVIYGPGEKERAQEITKDMPPYINLAPQTENLEELFITLMRLNLLIACCGGTKHMALAAGVPTVTIHSMTYAEAWTPSHNPKHIALKVQAKCSPCFRSDCPHNMICMATVPPQKVFEAAQKIL